MNDIKKLVSALAFAILSGFVATRTGSAQTLSASGQLTSTGSGGAFHYTLVLSNSLASTTNIETFWFAWLPGEDFMPANPTNIGNPSGWMDTITHGLYGDGYAIQFVTSTAPLAPGGSLTFTFTSTTSPSIMAGNSSFGSRSPILTSFVYSGAPETGLSDEFTVESSTEPAPNPTNLVSFAFSNVVQSCKTKIKVDKMTQTTNTMTTCKLSLQLVVTNIGITNSPAFNALIWAGQGSNFDSTAGLPSSTAKIKALKINRVDNIKLKDVFDSSLSGTFIFCTDGNTNVLTSVEVE